MEQPLEGGNMTPGVVRVEQTVRRPRGERAEFAAAAVTWLNAHGFPYAARYLGIDDAGRDIFEYVDGDTTEHPAQRDERSYAVIGRILRELHTLTEGGAFVREGSSLLHGDPGPFNVVCRDGMPVALIDWDSAHSGDPMVDVGYAAWTWCAGDVGGTMPAEQAVRLRTFRDAYDPTMPASRMFDAIERAQQGLIIAESAILQDSRHDAGRRTHAKRAVLWAQTDRTYLARNIEVFRRALGDETAR